MNDEQPTDVPVLAASDVHVSYRREHVVTRALRGVSIDVARGEVLGIVGESGCGKSTLARCIVGLTAADSGTITLDGATLTRRSRDQRRRIQMVFQDPRSALNPRRTVRQLIEEGWSTHRAIAPSDWSRAAADALETVGLDADLLDRRPSQISGGQAQRVAIARALAVRPEVLVCDEAVSALDVSVQSQILDLLASLRADLGLTMVFISHDLGVIRQIADRVAVMYFGEVVETGDVDTVFDAPQHPYTLKLLDAALDVVLP